MTIAELTSGWARPCIDPAVSRDAKLLRGLLDRGSESESNVLSRMALGALRDACARAAQENWDGYGAQAVSPAVCEQAEAFLQALPTTAPVPEVVPEPDGEIAFEWDRGPWRVFSVSVGPSGTLSYAGLYGRKAKVHGTELFMDRLPKPIADGLARLIALGDQ